MRWFPGGGAAQTHRPSSAAEVDPAAATEAWLRLIPAATRAAADRRAEAATLAWGLQAILPLAGAWLTARSGLSERAWAWGARRGPWLSWLAVLGLVSVLSCALELILGALAAPAELDVSGFGLAVLLRLVLLMSLYGLLKLAGPRPRAGLALAAFIASFALVYGPTLAGELGHRPSRPAPAPLAAAALDLARRSGVAVAGVELSDAAGGEGDIVGLLRAPRLLAPDAPGLPRAEVLAKVGHVLGHYRAHDLLAWALLLGALGAGGGAFAVGLFPTASRHLGSEARPRLSDPRAAAVVWALAAVWLAIATPAAFAFDRFINLRADRFSLDHAREPDGLAAALARENGLAPVDPPPLVRWIVCSHPPLKARLAQAMAWKAAHRP